ncbi:MAG: LolA family protein [Pyrinomonadaceae bacterium]
MKNNIALPLIVLLLFAFGCSQIREMANTSSNSETISNSTSNSESTTTADSQPSSGEFTPTSDAKADIEKMADRFLALKSFSAKMEGEGKTPMKTDLEFVSPDRYRLKMVNGMEMIVIGNTSYMNIGGSWRKMTLPLDSTITDMRKAFDKDGRKWFSDVKYEGEETVDGKPAYVYAYHNKGPGAGVGENDSKLWIGKNDGMPIKIEAQYKSGNLRTMKIVYDLETPVTIEPPIK